MTTYSKDQARAHIAQLVTQFQQNEAALLNTEEANIENNFVRPLFRYLNWNVDNTGLAEPQWEFVLQRTMRQGNRPDYILQLDGQQLFVMDAKKAKYAMHDPRWLNQVYAYAYSTQNNAPAKKMDFAILTDFQEFIVLDCTLFAAKPEAIHAFRVIDWRYTDYIARFDELWDLFERNNVLAARRGVLLNAPTGIWSRYLSPKKVKANRVPPDKAFLAALDDEKTGWRVRLAKEMKKRNPALDGNVLTAAVQLLIDRLIFVKVLSDREIEDDYLAKLAELVERDGLTEADCGWFVACQNLFAELNTMYNGSIFAPRPELEAVTVSNQVVRAIIEDLLPENSPYNFAMLPVEILGTIYERFLGRVVHATDARVKIEDKPEVRKAGGVYYTPQYIVNYIVANTVGKLLSDCKTPADVARLKILDPACGSGSFLLGAYNALIEWHRNYYARRGVQLNAPTTRDAFYRDEDGRVRLTAKLKRQILLNNLFGVDIDPQAVEVTRLSLSLKALEDTRSDEAHYERTLFNQTLLPDLSANIKCGNSLIGTDYLVTSDEELRRVKPFDWASGFSQVFGSDRPGRSLETFQVSDARGFDAVIGNPPYIRVRIFKEFYPEQIKHLESHYVCATHVWDIYLLFYERALQIARSGGRVGFIVPIQTLHQPNCESLRKLLLSETSIESIADLSKLKIFEGAIIKNCILVCERTTTKDHTIDLFSPNSPAELFEKPVNIWPQQKAMENDGHSLKLDLMSPKRKLCEKLESRSWRLDELCYVTFGLRSSAKGVGQGGKERLITTNSNARNAKPYLEGRNIKRYATYPTGRFIRYIPEEMYSPRTPALFETKKIVSQSMLSKMRLIATLDDSIYYVEQSLVCIIPHGILTDITPPVTVPLEFILGVINSNLESFYFSTQIIDYSLGGGLVHATPGSQSKLLVPRATQIQIQKLVAAIQNMLALHKSLAAAQTETDRELYQRQIDATDKQIDTLVYELYGLTDEEIKIVEGR
ncbi:MAG: N-6 DNA methylase [Chloroflexi bacterium]|nr:N-6 DNA methylase [Chloroflexota bacterium]